MTKSDTTSVKHKGTENLIPFKPGQSGNLKGRPPRTYSITTAMQELLNGTSVEAVKAKWLKDQKGVLRGCQLAALRTVVAAIEGDDKAAQSALHELLNRTEGKASQPIEVPEPIEHSVTMVIERVGKSDKTSDK